MMVEGDDETMEFVTFEHVTINTRNGPVTTSMEVPLRPLEIEQQTSHPGSPGVPSQEDDYIPGMHSDAGICLNLDTPEQVMPKPAKQNKVFDVLYDPGTKN
jgi:hypothetical protein